MYNYYICEVKNNQKNKEYEYTNNFRPSGFKEDK
jgi:hypothetical protein